MTDKNGGMPSHHPCSPWHLDFYCEMSLYLYGRNESSILWVILWFACLPNFHGIVDGRSALTLNTLYSSSSVWGHLLCANFKLLQHTEFIISNKMSEFFRATPNLFAFVMCYRISVCLQQLTSLYFFLNHCSSSYVCLCPTLCIFYFWHLCSISQNSKVATCSVWHPAYLSRHKL